MDQYSCAALFTRLDNICKKLYLKIVPKKKEAFLPNQWLCVQTRCAKFFYILMKGLLFLIMPFH